MLLVLLLFFFLFKQKTAYEMRISDWSSDVCSSDLEIGERERLLALLDRRDGLDHRTFVARDIIGQAALAWAQPRRARRGAVGEESDVLAQRVPRRAARPAIDAGGEHAGDETPIERAVTAQHRRPAIVVGHDVGGAHAASLSIRAAKQPYAALWAPT